MPVTVVVGAQFGSEGKGKVALEWARQARAVAAVRVGGPNSGHTVVHGDATIAFQQLPTAALIDGTIAVLPPGTYLDLGVLRREIELVGARPSTLVIDPRAVVITDADREVERAAHLRDRIGSTLSGTGAAVARRVMRGADVVRARDVAWLAPFLADTLPLLRSLNQRGRIIVEGTQGYGLSLLHGSEDNHATSRDTTAASFISEAGLSPFDVDEIVLVARAFPIRVAGNSGILPNETTWDAVAESANQQGLREFTTVTHKLRRVGEFDPGVVRRAIAANRPTHIVLNHLDYVADLTTARGRQIACEFVQAVERDLEQPISHFGRDERNIWPRATLGSLATVTALRSRPTDESYSS